MPPPRHQRLAQLQRHFAVLGRPAVRHQVQLLAGAACARGAAGRRHGAHRQRHALQQALLRLVALRQEGVVGARGGLLVQQRKHRLVC